MINISSLVMFSRFHSCGSFCTASSAKGLLTYPGKIRSRSNAGAGELVFDVSPEKRIVLFYRAGLSKNAFPLIKFLDKAAPVQRVASSVRLYRIDCIDAKKTLVFPVEGILDIEARLPEGLADSAGDRESRPWLCLNSKARSAGISISGYDGEYSSKIGMKIYGNCLVVSYINYWESSKDVLKSVSVLASRFPRLRGVPVVIAR